MGDVVGIAKLRMCVLLSAFLIPHIHIRPDVVVIFILQAGSNCPFTVSPPP